MERQWDGNAERGRFMTVNEGIIYNRIKGALYGVAIGDALGAPREFLSAEEAMLQFGPAKDLVGGGVMNCTAGHGTDDTQMTLEEAYAILENPKNPVPVAGDRFIEWMIHDGEGIGISTSHVLSEGLRIRNKIGTRLSYDQWMMISNHYARSTQRAGGNGALMRSVYPGLYYTSRNMAANKAIQLARITHWDKNSDRAVMVYTQFVFDCTSRYELPEKDQMQEDLIAAKNAFPKLTEIASYMSLEAEPSGWVVDSMKNALDAFQRSSTFEETLVDAVERGGDADTIGAIAGGIAGARYGFDKIPDRWLAQLDPMIAKSMDELADAAFRNRFGAKENLYRISFIDGHSLKYGTYGCTADTREDAMERFYSAKGREFDHMITSIVENGKLIMER